MVSDALVLLFAVAMSLGTSVGTSAIVRPLGGATAVVLVAAALTLLWRRRAPLTVAWISVATAAVVPISQLLAPGRLLGTGDDIFEIIWWPPAAPFAAYAAMAFAKNRWISWLPVAAMLATVCSVVPMVPDHGRPPSMETDPAEAFGFRSVVVIVLGALLGMYARARRRALEALTERAERAEREQHLLAEQARAEERARLAAEMHDVVAHRVTLMVLQAGALRVRAPDDETRLAAEDLRATGSQALEELRDVIGLLRRSADGGPAAEVHEPLPDLSALVTESVSVGVPVQLVEEGDPPLASPVVGRTAYRIVQESLTNVHKHAPGARVRVYVRYGTRGVRLSVRNTPPDGAADAVLAGAGSGTGLLGLRQRVELIGGRMRAAPARDGGFRVEAYLPAYVPTAEPEPAP